MLNSCISTAAVAVAVAVAATSFLVTGELIVLQFDTPRSLLGLGTLSNIFGTAVPVNNQAYSLLGEVTRFLIRFLLFPSLYSSTCTWKD